MPTVNAKKKCCKDKPRCKTCPVVLNRLAKGGYAERLSRREYRLVGKTPKAVRAAARAR